MTGREVFVQSGIKFPQVIYIKLLSFLVKKNHGFSLSDFFFLSHFPVPHIGPGTKRLYS